MNKIFNVSSAIRMGALSCLLFSSHGMASVSEGDAAKLGQELTPIGAEKAGNSEGTIPVWEPVSDGGIHQQTSNGPGNPFKDDAVLFTIDQSNLDTYREFLSPGQIAMLTKYPTFKMKVYPSRRSSGYPTDIYDATRKNATTISLNPEGTGLVGDYIQGVPFPVPTDAKEVLWNHFTRYRGGLVERVIHRMAPQTNGDFVASEIWQKIAFNSHLEDGSAEDNILYYFVGKTLAPARNAGSITLVHETMDQVKEPRKAWIYNAGQRRVRRAPQVAYDSPQNNGEGQATSDNMDMYNGAPDRYDWKLLGKKELYIPYNNYQLHDKSLKYDEIIKPSHINSDFVRYELHRVWVVEGTLKEGSRHIYNKRTFFIDEDTWQISVADHYDQRDELWRLSEAYHFNFNNESTNQIVPWYTAEAVYDLMSGRYLVNGLSNEVEDDFKFGGKEKQSNFKPSALRRMGGKL
ncbi:DUF1329 domain-containing protein [Litoribrevibacter albus]|uniref:DUF1329 domain-containing protein n=1 Tax=Litoribrevibacter albus TaxID=1473156 RepID=A0AA37S8R4_9GAMM|nr:DUF1329 domain-containing protein [Litoribrevibacter albus]GLQ30440.1 hypothetical protein GCM10007876_09180 [Litoribrevibacter albus]